jgi:hypothetical protein
MKQEMGNLQNLEQQTRSNLARARNAVSQFNVSFTILWHINTNVTLQDDQGTYNGPLGDTREQPSHPPPALTIPGPS